MTDNTVDLDGDIEPIIDVADSPINNSSIIERTGGDDFIKAQIQSHSNSSGFSHGPIVMQQATEENMPSGFASSSEFTPPPTPGSNYGMGPQEFTVVDPEAEMMQQASTQTVNMESEMTEESTNMLADMFIKGAAMILPEAANSYYAINENQIKKLESEGKLPNGASDQIKDINRKNRGRVKFDKEKQNFLRKPLEQVLAVSSIKANPTTLLIIAVCFILGMMAIESYRIKRENDDLVQKMIEGWQKTLLIQRAADGSTEAKIISQI